MEKLERLCRDRIRRDDEHLRKEFETVCRELFPRWKSWKEWKVRYDLLEEALGMCDRGNKTIVIRTPGFLDFNPQGLFFQPYDDEETKYYCWINGKKKMAYKLTPKLDLWVLLTHEISHAVVPNGPDHGMGWENEMMRAVRRAKALGKKGLSFHLRRDVEIFKDKSTESEE